jgi:predicted alpha/beta-hydrolase family hydrolase
MSASHLRIAVPGHGKVSALRDAAAKTRCALVYAPGAGSNLNDGFGAYLASQLPEAGVDVWRFQFPYSEAKRSAPDRPLVLEATWRAVLASVRASNVPVFAGGRSMGGRIASQVVAQGEDVAGLALFAYPLHPPGKPEQRRDAHLASIAVPTLFASGTRDPFGAPEELAETATLVKDARVHVLEGADHGFSVLKASGRTRDDVWAEATASLAAFIDAVLL